MIVSADIECDGLLDKVTKVWCIVLKELDKDNWFKFTIDNIDEGLRFIRDDVTTIIGHNFYGYDLPVLNKLHGLDWGYNCINGRVVNIVDTYQLSNFTYPDIGKHGLEVWGERLGVKKPPVSANEWEHIDMDLALFRCSKDVEITERVYKWCSERLASQKKHYKTIEVATCPV